MKPNLQALQKWAVQTARLCCGIPDYDVYVKHLREHHPERPVPLLAGVSQSLQPFHMLESRLEATGESL